MPSTSVHRSKQHIIHDIESVTRQPGFLHTLVFLCCRDLLVDPKEAANRNWRESLSYQAQIANMQKVACPYLDASEKGGGECQSGPSRRVCMRSPGLGRQPNADGQKPDYRTTVLQQKVLHQHDTVGALGSLAVRQRQRRGHFLGGISAWGRYVGVPRGNSHSRRDVATSWAVRLRLGRPWPGRTSPLSWPKS